VAAGEQRVDFGILSRGAAGIGSQTWHGCWFFGQSDDSPGRLNSTVILGVYTVNIQRFLAEKCLRTVVGLRAQRVKESGCKSILIFRIAEKLKDLFKMNDKEIRTGK